jgi:CRISPR-associated protein Csd1
MLLSALASYYHRLAAGGTDDLPAFGFSSEKISFCVVLERDGTLHAVEDIRDRSLGKPRPRGLGVPSRGGRSSGIKANFLWDNTGYVLGASSKKTRDERMFEAFRDLHGRFAAELAENTSYLAVVKFLSSWDPIRATEIAGWDEIRDKNVVFRLRGETEFVHESRAVKETWLRFTAQESDAVEGQCLVTGEVTRVARLHDLVSGFRKAQPSGAAVVSFNKPSFTSYDKEQGFNAPVGVETVFKYTTAFSILSRDRQHSIWFGDDTVLFWADAPHEIEEFFGPAIAGSRAEDESVRDRLWAFFHRLRDGRAGTVPENRDVRFFVAGISPNASRLALRFWHDSTVAEAYARLGEHLGDLAIVGDERDLPITARDILAETSRDPKDAPPLLAGALLRAILNGTPYPEALYAAILRRVRTDGEVPRVRAAILKACLLRRSRIGRSALEVSVSLDQNHPDPAYQLGRLFAELEKIQRDAMGRDINATIKDRFFGAASATPGTVFPRLIRLSQHHLSKIENPSYRVTHERRLGEICAHLKGFPAHLNLTEQGLFAIAYYHQNRALYTPAARSAPTSAEE